MKSVYTLWCLLGFCVSVYGIPSNLLYEYNVPDATHLPRGDDISREVKLNVPIIFYGVAFESIFINSNGILSFQTEIPSFFNIEFPLDYPVIAPFYSNVDTTKAGIVSYYETSSPSLLQRATENVHDCFLDAIDFQATSLFIVTWSEVGYYREGYDKKNTYQVVISTDGASTFVEFLYPENGIQWIQGTGDESGLPDARAQAGFVSPDGKVFKLTGSGTEQVRNLENWTNMGLEGQFIYRVDEFDIKEPDTTNENNRKPEKPSSCSESPALCHIQARCITSEEGSCCQCSPQYYGNGKFCVKKDVPLRVNGKVSGVVNGEVLDNLDLQSYIVMLDGRAYTAISKIPEEIGYTAQTLQLVGGVIGYLFAKPLRSAQNGYQLTGGIFNHSATLTFLNSNQTIRIVTQYLGLDVFDQLRLSSNIVGELPTIPHGSKVIIDEYKEQYTMTSPGVIQMSSSKVLTYSTPEGDESIVNYNVEQTFTFEYCNFGNTSAGQTWILKVGKNFISYEEREQIVRFGLSNKITPLGENDPCEEGRNQCGQNSACVVEEDSFRCVCNPGYQHYYTGNETICADVDECRTGLHDCNYNAECYNLIGTYSCRCNPGFEGDGKICENARSCANVQCIENAECVENNEIAMCKCLHGFRGDGQRCDPLVDHSCHTANNCSPYGYCAIRPESNTYSCFCLPGYDGDGYTCRAVATTTTTTTTTVPTTESDGQSCNVLRNCSPYGACIRNETTNDFNCICLDGYDGDGYNCETIGVTEPAKVDREIQRCLLGVCWCPSGYAIESGTKYCIPKNETNEVSTGDQIETCDRTCTETEECVLNSIGRYECVCKDGHERDSQHQCVPSGSCGGGICVENAECLFDDEVEAFYCSCKSGYAGDGITDCHQKELGCNDLNNCGQHATCEYDEITGSYSCVCSEGFYGNGYNCLVEKNCLVDPYMCDVNAACVTNANRSYICQCNNGYIGNGTFCKKTAKYEGNFLLVNQGMATLKIPLVTSKQNTGKPIQLKYYQTAVGLDIDCLEGRVYWGDISGRAIRSSTFEGAEKSDFIKDAIGSPEGLAVDWVSRNIYWTDSMNDTIEVANLDSKRRRTLFNTGLVNPRGITVHPQRGKIFWSDWNRLEPKIEWANADGTGRQIFLRGEAVSLPNSLTIDFDTEQLCYADAGTKKIECFDIDSRTRHTIAENCSYPFGIGVSDTHIYWTDWIVKKIESVEKFTLKREPSINVPLGGSGNKLFGLVAVPNSCPSLTNVCNKYECPEEHICLPDGQGSRRCLCSYRSDALDEAPSCQL